MTTFSKRWLTGWRKKNRGRNPEQRHINCVKPGEAAKPHSTKKDINPGWYHMLEHGNGPRKESCVSGYFPDQPQTRHSTVVGNREEGHHDQANSTLGNTIWRGLREEKRQVHRAPQRMQGKRLSDMAVPHWSRRQDILFPICVPTDGRKREDWQRLSQAAERASNWLWLRRVEKSWKLSTSTPWDGGATRYHMYMDKARNIYDGEHHAFDGGRWANHWPQHIDSSSVSGRRHSWVCTTGLRKSVRDRSSTYAGKQGRWSTGCFTYIYIGNLNKNVFRNSIPIKFKPILFSCSTKININVNFYQHRQNIKNVVYM